LTELHPGEFQHLLDNLSHFKSIEMRKTDGLEFIARLTKPHHLRGVVLVDPPYELKTEYHDVTRTIMRALNNWSSATYLVWYPILADGRHKQMVRSLLALGGTSAFESQLMAPEDIAGHGMKGSGLILLGAPGDFEETLITAMAEMKDLMFGPGAGEHIISKGQPIQATHLFTT
ncbi:23S rRNA (adenine(2030)-N(6))-methyltransferase RlmJ, partial [Kordiimonas sp.]|uniref:23S rRNA (adenine(2030)-N(6))-methyltransferase RlmJ n=1 Tax=Kordiimonas sp. TaxID=1970157 RepID=UPI003A922C02